MSQLKMTEMFQRKKTESGYRWAGDELETPTRENMTCS